MKRFCIFLVIFLLIAGCSQPDYLLDEKFHTEEFLPQYDMQSSYARSFAICESDNAYYFQLMGDSFLYYYDISTGISDKLCGKPECNHLVPTCNAKLSALGGLSYYDNKLYWIEANPATPGYASLNTISIDGTSREILHSFSGELNGSNPITRLHRGYLYAGISTYEVVDAKDVLSITIVQQPLHKDESDIYTIFKKNYTPGATYFYQLVANNMYILISSPVDQLLEIYHYDIATRDLTSLLTYTDYIYKANDLQYVDGQLYFSSYSQQTNQFVLETFNLSTKTLTTSVPMTSISFTARLGQEIIVTSHAHGENDLPQIRITDWNNNELFVDSLPLPDGNTVMGLNFITGDSEKVIFWMQLMTPTGQMYSQTYLVTLDATQDPILLCQTDPV